MAITLPATLDATNCTTTGTVQGDYTTLDPGEVIETQVQSPGGLWKLDTLAVGPGTAEILIDGVVVKTWEIP